MPPGPRSHLDGTRGSGRPLPARLEQRPPGAGAAWGWSRSTCPGEARAWRFCRPCVGRGTVTGPLRPPPPAVVRTVRSADKGSLWGSRSRHLQHRSRPLGRHGLFRRLPTRAMLRQPACPGCACPFDSVATCFLQLKLQRAHSAACSVLALERPPWLQGEKLPVPTAVFLQRRVWSRLLLPPGKRQE